MILSILGLSNLFIVVAQPDKRYANRTAFDRHRAYCISGSNEELLILSINSI